MAVNETGLNDVTDYQLGRGILYAAFLGDDGKPDAKGWRDLGNCVEFSLSMESETLEHQSSRTGLKVVDLELLLSQKMELTFALDEINDDNLALFLSGETSTHTNVAVAGFSEYKMVTGVKLGRWYDIVNSSGERAYGIDPEDLTLEKDDTEDVALDATDFILDAEMGRIFLKSTATHIADGDDLNVTLAANAEASDVAEVRGMTEGNVQVALKFIAENPANENKKREYQFHKVVIRSEGEYALIGDEFSQLGLAATVSSAPEVDADAPFVRIRDLQD